MIEPHLEKILEFVEETLRTASGYLKEDNVEFSFKQEVREIFDLGGSVVTNLDYKIQEFIFKRLIEEGLNCYGMMAEEDVVTDAFNAHSPYQWVVDPLDGTLNFLSGVKKFLDFVSNRFDEEAFHQYYKLSPEYSATILGLKRGNEFLVSGIYFPLNDIFFAAVKGQGSYRNGERFWQQGSTEQTIIKANSLIYRYLTQKNGKIVKANGAGCTLIEVAEKGNVGYIGDAGIYDAGPCSLIITEAGGLVSDHHGKSLGFSKERIGYFVAGSSVEHNQEIVRCVKETGFKF